MFYGEETIVDISREFLDTNGVKQVTDAVITDNYDGYFASCDEFSAKYLEKDDYIGALKAELNRLDVCSQKGMGETFDGSIGAASVFMPFGGKYQLTPSTVMAAKPPTEGFTHTVTASSYACYPRLMTHSPFTGAVYSIVSAVGKLISAGVGRETIRLSLQEFFKRLGTNPERWGEPLSALLGAFEAQLGLKMGAIGGKDSMSGTFENIDVPPTVIAFAMGVTDDDTIIHNVFDRPGRLYLFSLKRDEKGYPDFGRALEMYDEIHSLIKPKFFIPVHGERRHLQKHAELAMKMGMLPTNIVITDIGNVAVFTKKSIRIGDNVPSGCLLVDGLGVGDAGSVVLRDRKHLSEEGMIVAVMGINSLSGEVYGVDITSRGFMYTKDESEKLLSEAKEVTRRTLEGIDLKGVGDWTGVKNAVRKDLKNLFFKRTRRNPMIIPVVMEN